MPNPVYDRSDIRPWSGTSNEDLDLDNDAEVTRGDGWPISFSQAGAAAIRRKVLNKILFEITSGLVEVFEKGILPWNSVIAYKHTALTTGSNGLVYISKRNSTNKNPTLNSSSADWEEFSSGDDLPSGLITEANLVDKIDDLVANTYWRTAHTDQPGAATTAVPGIVRLAVSGGSQSRAATASYVAAVAAMIPGAATTAVSGIVRLATSGNSQSRAATASYVAGVAEDLDDLDIPDEAWCK